MHEGFALHRPAILDTERFRYGRSERVRRRGRDAVDHRSREEHFVLDPLREVCVGRARELRGRARELRAVVDQVVATDDGKRRDAVRAPSSERLAQKPHDAARRAHVLQITDDVRMRHVERAIARETVALLGNRDRDDVRGRRTQARQDRFGILGRNQQLANRADHFAGDGLVTNSDGVEIVLRGEGVPHIRISQRHRADPPARILCEQALDEPRLMRAMKCAGPEMHDAGGERVAVVFRGRDRGGEVA